MTEKEEVEGREGEKIQIPEERLGKILEETAKRGGMVGRLPEAELLQRALEIMHRAVIGEVFVARVGRDGRITIPKRVRESLMLSPGSKVRVQIWPL